MFDLSGFFSMLLMLLFFILGVSFLILKIVQLLLVGWTFILICFLLAIIFLLLGANGIG